MRLRYAELDAVMAALTELGKNRLVLAQTVRLHNITKPFREAVKEREELRLAICTPYFPKGEQKPRDEDIPEVTRKVLDLWGQEVEVAVGEPLDLAPFVDSVQLDANSLGVLLQSEIVKIEIDAAR